MKEGRANQTGLLTHTPAAATQRFPRRSGNECRQPKIAVEQRPPHAVSFQIAGAIDAEDVSNFATGL